MCIEIKTARLSLRLLSEQDLDDIASLGADPEVRAFFPAGTVTREQTSVRLTELMDIYARYKIPGFVMHCRHSGDLIGRCGFGLTEKQEVEVGYLLHKSYWGQGYASEATSALLQWAKQHLDTPEIIGFAPVDHLASQRVLQKCGMSYYKNDIAHGVECRFFRISNACS
ncbi:GNAT family N-acetyltransferase [Dongshaea marina]|uniref:GNAT family N-acetyltransferase n=1 Tax=Dongshaea marina TaxID=2047966 RepID=UPI000D3E9EAD|nr:GNAT family N-acetyltransferase [Dongshaea marina]